MRRRQPRSTRTDTLLPYTTLCRSAPAPAPVEEKSVAPAQAGAASASEPAPAAPASAGATEKAAPAERASDPAIPEGTAMVRSEEHTSELQSLMRISYAVFCLKTKNNNNNMIRL